MSENETQETTAEVVDAEATEQQSEETKAEETPATEEVKAEETATAETATEETAAAETPAEETPAEEAKAPEPEEEEEISYHAVEKEGEITAIWEMQGRKHIRTISARSGEGEKILSLFTSEIHETDSPAMSDIEEATA